jgi:hypothetical protein
MIPVKPSENYHNVSDSLKGILTTNIPKFLKKKHSGENPEQWELCGFVPWKAWHQRVKRAKQNLNPNQKEK